MGEDLKASAARLLMAPAAEPISLAEAITHLRAVAGQEDDLIQALVQAAREHVEDRTGRRLITQAWTGLYPRFPSDAAGLELPGPPLQSVEAIRYTVRDGTQSTLAPAVYAVDADSEPGRVLLKPDQAWPTDELRDPHPVEVDFTAGYGDAGSDVPSALRSYMKLLVGALYENRESVVTGMIVAEIGIADSLLVPYRVFWPA